MCDEQTITNNYKCGHSDTETKTIQCSANKRGDSCATSYVSSSKSRSIKCDSCT